MKQPTDYQDALNEALLNEADDILGLGGIAGSSKEDYERNRGMMMGQQEQLIKRITPLLHHLSVPELEKILGFAEKNKRFKGPYPDSSEYYDDEGQRR